MNCWLCGKNGKPTTPPERNYFPIHPRSGKAIDSRFEKTCEKGIEAHRITIAKA